MFDIKLDDDIALPVSGRGSPGARKEHTRKLLEVLRTMTVGQSFMSPQSMSQAHVRNLMQQVQTEEPGTKRFELRLWPEQQWAPLAKGSTQLAPPRKEKDLRTRRCWRVA